jgi:hypothetical protein
LFASLHADVQAAGAATCSAPLLALPSTGWTFLQHMLPSASGLCNESPCSCMIKFGVVMDFLGADADAPSGAPQ